MSFALALGPPDRLAGLTAQWRARRTPLAAELGQGDGLFVIAGAQDRLNWSADRRTIAIGLIIDRATGQPAEALDFPEALGEVSQFLRRYWGRYVIAGRTPAGDRWVFRDPSAGQGAYRLQGEGLDLLLSDASIASALAIDCGDIDPDFLVQWLAFPFLRTGRTGFAHLREVLPGERLQWNGLATHSQALWIPAAFARPDGPLPDFDDAADRLRSLLHKVVPAMVGDRRSPLVQLSGGLDSAIIAGVLGAAGRPFKAANYHGPSADSDERRFARDAARSAGIDLHEFAIPPARPRPPLAAPLAFRPLPNAALRPLFDALEAAVQGLGADALVDGTGGDNLFCYLTTAAPPLDALRDQGMGAAWRALDDVATLCNVTLWAVALAAMRKRVRSRLKPRWRRDLRFLDPAAMPATCDPHPWLDFPSALPPGKREHIEALVSIQHFLDRGQSLLSVPMLHPLLAQPLLEYCLSLPSWMWCRGGRDRAIARAAMAGRLPPPIIARRSKGRIESLFLRTYRAQRGHLRDLLLGGELAGRGLVDELAVSEYLLRPGDPVDDGYFRLLEMAALEDWLRSVGR